MSTHQLSHARWPGFFIIGAPKCGTTSLAHWLAQHPKIFMSRPKEPNFYSTDIRSMAAVTSEKAYAALFRGAGDEHAVVGEASTTYLRSDVAVPKILEKMPSAKFIVCLRDPVEMVASVHAQLLRGGRESEPDLETAWKLQASRKQGRDLPLTVIEARDLQYGEMCLLGAQVQRLLGRVERDRVHFVWLQDIRSDPRVVYEAVLDFLAVATDDRQEFGIENPRALPRSPSVALLLNHAMRLKHYLGLRGTLGLGSVINKVLFSSPAESDRVISVAFERKLNDFFSEDRALLRRLAGAPRVEAGVDLGAAECQ